MPAALLTALPEGEVSLVASIQGFAGNVSEPAQVIFTVDTIPPLLALTAPPDGAILNTNLPEIRINYSDIGSGVEVATLNIQANGTSLPVNCAFAATSATCTPNSPLPEGVVTLTGTLRDFAGNLSPQAQVNFTVDTTPPQLAFTAPAEGSTVGTTTPTTQISYSDAGSGVDTATLSIQANGGALGVDCSFGPASASCTPTEPLAEGPATLTATLRDLAGNLSPAAQVSFTIQVSVPLPPDPASVASAVNRTVTTTLGTATEFLYTGNDPIQTGVVAGTIEARRAAVLRGQVLDRQGAPLPGVTINILNHPELDQTLSRTDGRFDLAVNGGELLTVNYEKGGFLSTQRQVDVPWQDYVLIEDVVMVAPDSQVTPVDLASGTPQVARGSPVTDADGTRQATLFFPAGTGAEMVLPDGSTQPISSLAVRATEYTVGDAGPQTMPALLPPTSFYTYAVALTVDEALAAGATRVNFTQPVPFYMENFLDFPVGIDVPLGNYDLQRGE